jgi:hypothetical protein
MQFDRKGQHSDFIIRNQIFHVFDHDPSVLHG